MNSLTKSKWPLQRILTSPIVYGIAIALLLGIALLVASNLTQLTKGTKLVASSNVIDHQLGDVQALMLEAEFDEASYLVTGNERDTAKVAAFFDKTEEILHSIKDQSINTDRDKNGHKNVNSRLNRLQLVEQAVDAKIAEITNAIKRRKDKGTPTPAPEGAMRRREELDKSIRAVEENEEAFRKQMQIELNELYWSSIYAFCVAEVLLLLLSLGIPYMNSQRRKELNLNSEWFSTTLRSIGDAVIATDARGRIAFMNGIAEDLTGWKESEAVDLPLDQVFRVIDTKTRKPVIDPVGRVLASGEIQDLPDHNVLVARDGTELPVDDSAAPIKVEGGTIRGVVLVFRDVTRDKVASAERERLYQALSERDKRKDEFLAMLAH